MLKREMTEKLDAADSLLFHQKGRKLPSVHQPKKAVVGSNALVTISKRTQWYLADAAHRQERAFVTILRQGRFMLVYLRVWKHSEASCRTATPLQFGLEVLATKTKTRKVL